MKIQDLEETTKKIKLEFKRNPNKELKAFFKELRAEARTTFFGDFVLMVEIVREADLVKPVTWKRIYSMLTSSEEYQELSKGEKTKYMVCLYFTATRKLKCPTGRKI